MTLFASSIKLLHAADNLWLGESDPLWAHPGGRFGGWTAAVLLKAAMSEPYETPPTAVPQGRPGTRGDPLSLTVIFTDAVNDGPIEISTRLLRAGSRLEFWRAELIQAGKVRAPAQITFGMRRATISFADAVMPEAPPPNDPSLVKSGPPTKFGEQIDARWLTASPLAAMGGVEGPARSVFWVRQAGGLAMDHVLLALLADYAPPRAMYRRASAFMSSTVSMNVYFHATPEELEAVGDDFVLSEVVCRRCDGGYFDHALTLWSRSGALLATSEQVAAFRD